MSDLSIYFKTDLGHGSLILEGASSKGLLIL